MATPIPRNEAVFDLVSVLEATAGAAVVGGERGARAGVATGVSTDTRALGRGSIFVALRGESHDGHAHVEAAAKGGASIAIVERDVAAPPGLTVVRVASTLDALGALARAHVRRWRAAKPGRKVVAITGSAGKTTTRVATAALLEALMPGEVLATIGNLNNRVGLPMMALGLRDEHRVAVLEAGMNQPGEIAALASIAEPDVALITLIAAAHTELVGTIEDVAREKGELVRALAPEGVAIGNGDDARVRARIAASPARTKLLYGRASDASVRVVERETLGLDRSRVRLATRLGELAIVTPLLGEAGALATAAGISVAIDALGLTIDASLAERAFASSDVGGGAGRLVPRVFASGLAVVDDTYNANPASVRASILAASEIARATSRRLVLVLGEMRELGVESARGHDDVGEAAASSGAKVLVAIGGDAKRIVERASERGLSGRFFASTREAIDAAAGDVEPGDLVLVKGSRAVATERFVAALAERHGAREKPLGAAGVKEST